MAWHLEICETTCYFITDESVPVSSFGLWRNVFPNFLAPIEIIYLIIAVFPVRERETNPWQYIEIKCLVHFFLQIKQLVYLKEFYTDLGAYYGNSSSQIQLIPVWESKDWSFLKNILAVV